MTSRTTLGVIIAILLLLVGYLFYQNTQLRNDLGALNTQYTEMQTVQDQLNEDYNAALSSIESLRSDNTELNTLIDQQKAELKKQKDKINGLIWTQKELSKAKDEIAKFENLTAQYLAEISELKAKTEQLTADNTRLKTENTNLSQNLTIEKEANERLQEARQRLSKEKSQLTESNEKLSNKVDIGSAIKINWMSFEGGEIKDDGSWKRRKRIKKVETMRTCFRTESNYVVRPGEEKFYLRIVSPEGSTLSADQKGSGILTNKLTGEEVKYTISGTLDYNNEDAEACMDWNVQTEPQKGTYLVEIYNKDYKVGEGTFEL